MVADGGHGGVSLVETVAARLCHDLSGLVGTLMGTLELAEEESDPTEALSVTADAARTLGGRLRLMRAAWGGVGARRDGAEMAELLSHQSAFPRSRTDWSAAGSGHFSEAMSRLLLNLAMVGTQSMPRGGVVHLRGRPDGTVLIVLEGPNARWPQGWQALVDGAGCEADLDGHNIQQTLAVLFARADGIDLSWEPAGADGVPVLVVRG